MFNRTTRNPLNPQVIKPLLSGEASISLQTGSVFSFTLLFMKSPVTRCVIAVGPRKVRLELTRRLDCSVLLLLLLLLLSLCPAGECKYICEGIQDVGDSMSSNL